MPQLSIGCTLLLAGCVCCGSGAATEVGDRCLIAGDPRSLTTGVLQKTRASTTAVGTKLAVPKPVNLPSMRKVGSLAARCDVVSSR
jgi:hypothetical protein